MPTNFYMFFVAAIIPLLVGAVYYHPKVAGTAWMKSNNFTEESLKGANMALIFGLSYLMSVLLALFLSSTVIHQGAIVQSMMPEVMEPGSEAMNEANAWLAKYGNRFRTWSHGAVHGVFVSLFFVLPILAINSLFERRGWKYTFIHLGYWTLTLVAMGALLCATLEYAPLS